MDNLITAHIVFPNIETDPAQYQLHKTFFKSDKRRAVNSNRSLWVKELSQLFFRSFFTVRFFACLAIFGVVAKPALSQQTLFGAIKTQDGHFLTAVGGGGIGGVASGPGLAALLSDATAVGVREAFTLVWTNPARCEFSLKTANDTFITAVNGGNIGGPNDARSPFHTDARTISGWEKFEIGQHPDGIHVFLRTSHGRHFVSAANGGGIGGPNSVPVHTDATRIGAWERFVFVSAAPIHCDQIASVRAPQQGFEQADDAGERLANQQSSNDVRTPAEIEHDRIEGLQAASREWANEFSRCRMQRPMATCAPTETVLSKAENAYTLKESRDSLAYQRSTKPSAQRAKNISDLLTMIAILEHN